MIVAKKTNKKSCEVKKTVILGFVLEIKKTNVKEWRATI